MIQKLAGPPIDSRGASTGCVAVDGPLGGFVVDDSTGSISIATASRKDAARWDAVHFSSWSEFLAWLDLDHPQSTCKECADGWVAARLRNGQRRRDSVISRSLLTLDADYAGPDFLERVREILPGIAWAAHTTWRSTPESPRWRVIVPLVRPVDADTYADLAGRVVEAVGRDRFDVHASTQPERFMWRPGDGSGAYASETAAGASLSPSWSAVHPYAAAAIRRELDRLTRCAELGWDGEPWNDTTYAVAANLIEFANSSWSGYDLERAEADHAEHAPTDDRFGPAEIAKCWNSALQRIGDKDRPNPDSDQGPGQGGRKRDHAPDLADSTLTEWTGDQLRGMFTWAAGLGWLGWDGRVWADDTGEAVTEAVRRLWRERYADEIREGCTPERAKALQVLLSAGKIRAVVGLMRGLLERRAEEFDVHPDLLTVGNGVVDLRSGRLGPHDPALLMTKATATPYVEGAVHEDWAAALAALPPEVADWMQLRFGQAATGHMPDDDVLTVLQGRGSNGKSTVVEAVTSALGDHAVTVPERLLLSNPGDHPTELTTLRGARLAVLEEAPEGRNLNVKRLKDTVGTPTITARRIRQDNVTWSATHSLFLTTNHRLTVAESDHGTWRRLVLVRFPFRYRKAHEQLESADDRHEIRNLRSRIKRGSAGRAEAVLTWIVEGARRWYDNDQTMPPPPEIVQRDTDAWRGETDHVLRFLAEVVEFDPGSMVLSTELLDAFNDWHTGRPWSDQTFAERFAGHEIVTSHDVEKTRKRKLDSLSRRFLTGPMPSGRVAVWSGLRFRDDLADGGDLL